ncbi:MAG: AAA family ATPase [Bryobacteraceae bacterium]|nr:AAA family ATPase [Bryobacteraceae bacterium]
MYVVTFYSFKGGVGRTLALVNVAAELVRRGKKVLVVDFDLEAPGLDSFASLRCNTNAPGLLEFVTQYLESAAAPDVSSFISQCKSPPSHKGKLYMMASGVRDASYSFRLSKISWSDMYAKRDGYLLFEDLKAQWASTLTPDYVLIDSRTGHSDVAGICTRQLPDAVVLCFIPNEDNIMGLEGIVSDIRSESKRIGGRDIRLYFVPSNVPSLDDEQGILERKLRRAKRVLGFSHPAATVHRYDSLKLLDNPVFVNLRNRSRLAKELRILATVITQDNLEDRDAVLSTLRSERLIESLSRSTQPIDQKITNIKSHHARDGEVLYELSKLLLRLGRDHEAALLAGESMELGYRTADTLLPAALEDLASGRSAAGAEKIVEALSLSSADYFHVSRAVEIAVREGVVPLQLLVDSAAFKSLSEPEQASLCDQMLINAEAAAIVEQSLRRSLMSAGEVDVNVRNSLVLSLVAQGKFREAVQAFGKTRPEVWTLNIAEAFNLAMAEWGLTGRPPDDLFARVLEIGEAGKVRTKNVAQAIAISAWVLHDSARAGQWWNRAFDLGTLDKAKEFSAWRYLQVSGDLFLADLMEVQQMIAGADVLPRVFTTVRP